MKDSGALQVLLDRAVSDDPAVRGGCLLVEAPGLAWQGASGAADPQELAMRPDSPFQAASVTKMITATCLVMLAERGQINLDAGIGRYLTPSITEGLNDHGGRSCGPVITARQLLSHTSGVADFFGDGEPGPDGDFPFLAKMREEPDKLWDPLEVIAWTKANLQPAHAPGEGWHYADTGYVLAGLIIEAVTGTPLHEVYRQLLFAPLEMDHTYMLFREPTRPGLTGSEPSRAYAGDLDYGLDRSVTADWASGGLVTTAPDLARFLRAFAQDRVFEDVRFREQMLVWVPTGENGVGYGLGVRRFALEALGMTGFGELWGHTGFLKSFMLYWPQQDAVMCGTLNQSAAQGVFSTLRPVALVVPAVLRVLRDRRI